MFTDKNLRLAEGLVSHSYIQQAHDASHQRAHLITCLLSSRRMPDVGWSDETIEHFLHELSSMDSNNYLENAGVGEREGRLANALVRRRHFGLAHGIGRSGDVSAIQPKAAGSSLIVKLTTALVTHAMKESGIHIPGITSLVVPMSTGMTLSLTLRALVSLQEAQDRSRESITVPLSSAPSVESPAISPPPPPASTTSTDSTTSTASTASTASSTAASSTAASSTATSSTATSSSATPSSASTTYSPRSPSPSTSPSSTSPSTSCSTSPAGPPPSRHRGRYVIWPRIDQKTCLKCILSAGLIPLVVENRLHGDQLCTDVDHIRRLILRYGPQSIVCVLSTTSCFAPRSPDRLVEVARLCAELGVAHLVNNAYGLQCTKIAALLSEAARVGRLDAFVQSTDKNFMVPVGGAVVASASEAFIDRVSTTYAGRASGSPVLDVLITLLGWGRQGYRALLKERKLLFEVFRTKLSELASRHGERVLLIPDNRISLAMTLDTIAETKPGPTFLGSMLFSRCCSGNRIVTGRGEKEVGGIRFRGYGAHCDTYPHAYLNVAAAIGFRETEMLTFLHRLESCLVEYKRKFSVSVSSSSSGSSSGSSSSGCSADEMRK